MRYGILFFLLSLCAFPTFAQEAEIIRFKSGSGFYVNPQGYLLTSRHVVSECDQYLVYDQQGMVTATKVDEDAKHDLVLLKTEQPAPWSGSFRTPGTLSEGDPVTVIGYPGKAWKRLIPVVKRSHVVALTGPMEEPNIIQFSNASAQGNSGGPLLDKDGNIVGMVVAKSTLKRIDGISQKVISISKTDVAIAQALLERFLDKNHVSFHRAEADVSELQAQKSPLDKRFIVNVRCRID